MRQLFTLLILIFVAGISSNTFAQEVKINTNLAVETDGTLRADGEATTWDDLRVPLSSADKRADRTELSGIPFGSSTGPLIDWFRASGNDEMYFVAQLPHSWKEGTIIYPHIHWIPSIDGAAGPTVPKWGLEYVWLDIGETYTSYETIYGTTTSTSEVLVANRHYLTSLGSNGIDGAGKHISSMLVCRIFRDGDDGADNFTGSAGALEVDFHYEINTMGSREPLSK